MWNDKETDLDLLGHNNLAKTIIDIMEEQELRPLTIGVYGSWGAGKSSVLSLIQSELISDPDTLCIHFNGWLFQGYEDTRSALMETIIGDLMRLQPTSKRVLRLGSNLLKRIDWLKVAKLGGSLAFTAVTGMPDPSLWGIPGTLKNLKNFISPKEEKSDTEEAKDSSEEESYLKEAEATVPGQIHAFRKELQELIADSKFKRVVVLVDDLDRCLPEAVIDILEAIRLFLFVEGTVFVLAADEQMIEYAVRRHFPDLPVSQADYTKHYLEKLVQIPIRVPSLNQLQVKNYIRFLLLQHKLQHDKKRLREISLAFEASKKVPYENINFTYEFICQQLGSENPDFKMPLIVAEQLGSVLADELRGNPRNIKRFLNTLFFRMRIANIYGISDSIHLDALAKLMVLERFHGNDYEQVVNEVTTSQDGKSIYLKELEEAIQEAATKSASTRKKLNGPTGNENEALKIWAALTPPLKEIDLRPYIFISREKAIGFASSEDLPQALQDIFDILISGTRMSMAGKERDIKALTPEQATIIFNNLEKESQKISDWGRTPAPVEGIFYLVQNTPILEEKLIKLFDSVPSKDVKMWMITNLAGLTTERGKAARKSFFDRILANPESNQSIKKIAKQLSDK